MTAIRTREIARCRASHICEDCDREIPRGDPCVEIIRADLDAGQVVSVYTCCKQPWHVRTTSMRELYRMRLADEFPY